jgi:DNA-binding beta-propeller fold protein YncE
MTLRVSAILLAACLHAASANPPVATPVWPAPPDEPRIAYVQSIMQPSDAGVKPSGFRRFSNWLTGASKGNASLNRPFGIGLDASGNLLVTETGNGAVSFYDQKANRWHRWHRAGTVQFSSPVAAAKSRDTFFVADSGLGAVLAFDIDGKLRFQIRENLERPVGIALIGDRLLVADAQRHCIVVFDSGGRLLKTFGQRGDGPGELNYPSHIHATAGGQILVTDSMNSRVQVFDAAGNFQRQIGSAGDGPGHFGRPKGVSSDRFGRIYVVDAVFDNVQVFDAEGQLLMHFGQGGNGSGEFWLPNGIAISADNRIYVADSYNNRVQVFQYVGK